jgi:hypothetical protein
METHHERSAHAPVTERLSPTHGALLHIVARDGDQGVVVVNLWETDEGRQAMAQEPEMLEARRKADIPPPAFAGYEVVGVSVAERLTRHAKVVS